MCRFLIAMAMAGVLAAPLVGPASAADFGRGVEAYKAGDYPTALGEFSELAEQGDARAQYNLGVMYANGDGVPQDQAEAVRWYRLAAEQGHASAQFNLGARYYNGEGVPANNVTAHMWFNIAAAIGYDGAREARGMVEGRMTPQDISEAQRRAQRCMDSGYRDCG